MLIRHASAKDFERIVSMEAEAYPKEVADSRESIRERLTCCPDCFWILEEQGEICSFINGLTTGERELRDEMYRETTMYDPEGAWLMILSVVTDPKKRHHGCASSLMKALYADCRREGREGIVLACRQELLPFYESFGYRKEGVSDSRLGNIRWYQMRLNVSGIEKKANH